MHRSGSKILAFSSKDSAETPLVLLSNVDKVSENGFKPLGDTEFVAAGNWLKGNVLAKVDIPEGMDIADAIKKLFQDERVLDVFLNGTYEIESFLPENMTIEVETSDPIYDAYGEYWHLSTAQVLGT